MTYDVAVLGLGAMGAAAAYQLAKRGAKTIGFDQFDPPHAMGSSCGDTRVTRLAIGEGEQYVPLVRRSHEIWREIERQTGVRLLNQSGGLVISSPGETAVTHVEGFFDKTIAAARRFGIAHEILDAGDIRRRWPQFNVRDDEVGYFEPSAGFVRPEECIHTQLELARADDAEIHTNERVLHFEAASHGVALITDKGRYAAGKLIISAGAWLPELLGGACANLFRVYRQVQFWFALEGSADPFLPETCPVFIWELQNSKYGIYGFPTLDGRSVKVASEQFEAATTPGTVAREADRDEPAATYENLVGPNIRWLGRRCLKATVCLYTVTPDFGFVIDRHPQSERVVIASACSGHGFKHSAAIGEVLAGLALEGGSGIDLAPFRLARFAGQAHPSPPGYGQFS